MEQSLSEELVRYFLSFGSSITTTFEPFLVPARPQIYKPYSTQLPMERENAMGEGPPICPIF